MKESLAGIRLALFLHTASIVLTPLSLGYGCTSHQSSACSSTAVYVQGPIRTIRPDPYDCVGTIDQRCSFLAK